MKTALIIPAYKPDAKMLELLERFRNNCFGEERKISTDDSKVQVWVIPTNEELAIALDTLEIATNK